MSLATIEKGRRVQLLGIKATSEIRGRLAALGLVPGEVIDVISNSANGPLVVVVKKGRVILANELADCVVVV